MLKPPLWPVTAEIPTLRLHKPWWSWRSSWWGLAPAGRDSPRTAPRTDRWSCLPRTAPSCSALHAGKRQRHVLSLSRSNNVHLHLPLQRTKAISFIRRRLYELRKHLCKHTYRNLIIKCTSWGQCVGHSLCLKCTNVWFSFSWWCKNVMWIPASCKYASELQD